MRAVAIEPGTTFRLNGRSVTATSPDDLERAVREAIKSRKPTLVNAIIDPSAGTESGRIGNLNPQSVVKKKA